MFWGLNEPFFSSYYYLIIFKWIFNYPLVMSSAILPNYRISFLYFNFLKILFLKYLCLSYLAFQYLFLIYNQNLYFLWYYFSFIQKYREACYYLQVMLNSQEIFFKFLKFILLWNYYIFQFLQPIYLINWNFSLLNLIFPVILFNSKIYFLIFKFILGLYLFVDSAIFLFDYILCLQFHLLRND